MEHCNEYVELISAAMDGALTPEETARLEGHLNSCPECKALFNDLNRVHQALLELPPVEVPAGLTDRILEAVARDNITALSKSKKTVLPWKRTLAAAAVFALILLGAGTINGRLNATKSAAHENLIAGRQDNNPEAIEPKMAPRTSEDATNEEDQEPAQGYQGISDPAAGQMTDTATPVEDTPVVQSDVPPEEPAQDTAQGAAKQSPVSTPEVRTTGAQAPEPQPTKPPSESEADPEVTTFTVGEVSALLEGVTDPETTVGITGSLFVLPAGGESPEGTDNELSNERAPEEPGDILSLTREESLALVVERCFGDSGYQMVRENLDGEPLSCHVSLIDGDIVVVGGTIVYTGETEEFFLFECHWDDDPNNPYHYSVHKTEGYVAWQGEVLGNEP